MSSKRNISTRASEMKPKTPTTIRRASSPIFPLLFITLLSLSLIPSTEAYTPLSDTSLSQLFSSPSSGTRSNFHPTTGTLLSPILIPRVPGTPGSEKVQQHFVDFFTRELPDWTLQWQNSTSTTPATGEKRVEFRNLIFRRDPPWLLAKGGGSIGEGSGGKFIKRLTLAAHYDSLYRPEGFVGAIDSAAPCAMLMAVARNVDGALGRRWEGIMERREGDGDGLEDFDGQGEEGEEGVQIVFLDGEEAWVEWSDEDSLYGSRALAEEWEGREYGVEGTTEKKKTELDGISLFVLLDLLGAPSPLVPSFFGGTHWAYQHLAVAEGNLRKMGLLGSRPEMGAFLQEGKKTANMFTGGYVLDDHVPFLRRGVPVLHVIPLPFPKVWHTMEDDGENLDVATVGDWARIVSVFVAEWMDVEGFVVDGGREKDEL